MKEQLDTGFNPWPAAEGIILLIVGVFTFLMALKTLKEKDKGIAKFFDVFLSIVLLAVAALCLGGVILAITKQAAPFDMARDLFNQYFGKVPGK